MKRKVIKQNNTTLVVSLPIKWVQQNNIKKGDSLEMIQNQQELRIKKDQKIVLKANLDLNLSGTKEEKERTSRILLNELYRKGFEEINITIKELDKPIIKSFFEKNRYVGFDILEEKENFLFLCSFVNPRVDEFEPLFQKLVFMCENLLKQPEEISIYFEKIERTYQFLRKIVETEGLPKQYIEILRYIILISHSINNLEKNKLSLENSLIQKDLRNFFNLVYNKLYFNKVKFEEVQKEYLNIEQKIMEKQNKKEDIFAWEILRVLSLGCVSINAMKITMQNNL